MARQLRQQLDEEVATIPRPDLDINLDPAARRPPGTATEGTPPPADAAEKPSGSPPPP
jgi:hypothetical protein